MSSAKRLAREFYETRKLALGHATAPQMGATSIDNGYIPVKDGDGNVVGIIAGDDGALVIDNREGPKPPKPSAPTVTADAGFLRVEWDGSFESNVDDEGQLATGDMELVEVHASMDPNFVPDRVMSFAGAYASLDGGSHAIGPLAEAGTYYVRLVGRSKAGKYSEPSEVVEQELAIAGIDLAITDAWLTGDAAATTADGKNSIYRGATEPVANPDVPFKEGDIWFEMTEDGKSIPNQWDGTKWVGIDDLRQSNIERVQNELRQELDAVIENGVGGNNYYQAEMPGPTSTPPPKEGDLWFDVDDKNKPYIYQAGEWVTVRDSFAPPADDPLGNLAPYSFNNLNDHALANQFFANPWQELKPESITISGSSITVMSHGVSPSVPVGTKGTTFAFQAKPVADEAVESDGTELPVTANRIRLRVQAVVWGAKPDERAAFRSQAIYAFDEEGQFLGQLTSYSNDGNRSVNIYPAGIDFTAPDPLWESGYMAALLGGDWVVTYDMYFESAQSFRAETKSVAIVGRAPAPVAGMTRIAITQTEARVQVASGSVDKGAITETKISDGAISTPKIQANAIETNHLNAKVVTGDKIAVGAITAESGIIGSINAGTITVGEMNGARIKANTVTADKVLIGTGGNLLTNPDFANEAAGWSRPSGITFAATGGKDGGGLMTIAASTSQNGSYLGINDTEHRTPIEPGRTYTVSAWVRSTSGFIPAKAAAIYVRAYDPSGSAYGWSTPTSATNLEQVPVNTWVKIEGQVKAPEDRTRFVLGLYKQAAHTGNLQFSRPTLSPAVGATLIEDGAITTSKILAGAITAESGIIGSIDANKITVGKIMGNQLDADAINGKTITGATIRTASMGSRVELTHNGLKQYNAYGQVITDMTLGSFTLNGGTITGATIRTAASGARVELTSAGLNAYNASGTATLSVSSETGHVSMVGDLAQDNAYGRIRVGPKPYGGKTTPAVQFGPPTGQANWVYPPGMVLTFNDASPALAVQGPSNLTGNGASRLTLREDNSGFSLIATDSNGAAQGLWTNNPVNAINLGSLQNFADGKGRGHINLSADEANIRSNGFLWGTGRDSFLRLTQGGVYMTMNHPSSSNSGYATLQLQDRTCYLGSVDSAGAVVGYFSSDYNDTTVDGVSRRLKLYGTGIDFHARGTNVYFNGTPGIQWAGIPTGSGTGVNITSGGWFQKNTSSRRYKTDIQKADLSHFDVLSLDPVSFVYIDQKERYERPLDEWGEYEKDTLSAGPPISHGLIAEEVEAAGGSFAVNYDEEGLPDSINYGLIGVSLIPIVRDLRDRITALEARLAAA